MTKLRPVLLLRQLPGFGDYLVCGISSQLRQAVEGYDVVLAAETPGFPATGLKIGSVIRLTFLSVLTYKHMERRLGKVPAETLQTLQGRLSAHLIAGHGS